MGRKETKEENLDSGIRLNFSMCVTEHRTLLSYINMSSGFPTK